MEGIEIALNGIRKFIIGAFISIIVIAIISVVWVNYNSRNQGIDEGYQKGLAKAKELYYVPEITIK